MSPTTLDTIPGASADELNLMIEAAAHLTRNAPTGPDHALAAELSTLRAPWTAELSGPIRYIKIPTGQHLMDVD